MWEGETLEFVSRRLHSPEIVDFKEVHVSFFLQKYYILSFVCLFRRLQEPATLVKVCDEEIYC